MTECEIVFWERADSGEQVSSRDVGSAKVCRNLAAFRLVFSIGSLPLRSTLAKLPNLLWSRVALRFYQINELNFIGHQTIDFSRCEPVEQTTRLKFYVVVNGANKLVA